MLLISFQVPKLIVQFNRHLLFFINVFELHKPSDFFFNQKVKNSGNNIFCIPSGPAQSNNEREAEQKTELQT